MDKRFIQKTKQYKINERNKQMRRQIRNMVFETNSSSTHSIAIPKDINIPNNVVFCIDEFGWRFESVDAADYFYTAIYETSETEAEAQRNIEKLKNILDAHDITYHFGKVKSHTWYDDYSNKAYFSLDDGHIDHGYELKDFVCELLNDENKLLRFLGGGLVFTGNDNSSTEERCFITRYKEYLDAYDWNEKKEYKVKNPYYMSNHEDYEWYYKGN